MIKVFASSALEGAVRAGDYDSVVELLRGMTPDDRRAERASIARLVKARSKRVAEREEGWEWLHGVAQIRAALAVALVCGTAQDAATLSYSAGMRDVIALGAEFRPPILPRFADEILKGNPGRIHDVQQMISAGLISRPENDDYTSGLLALFTSHVWQHGLNADIGTVIDETFKADPGLEAVLLRILDFEGTAAWNITSSEKNSDPEKRWSSVLLRLIDRGIYSRALILDKTLGALERGLNQSRSAWFLNIHEKLAPTIEEMAAHACRYLALLGNRIPLTVTFALGVIRQLEAAHLIAPELLVVALRPVASSAVKGQVDATIKLLDRVVKRQPAIANAAATSILPALTHESADLQKQVLGRLNVWGVDAAGREALGQYAVGIAAVHREEILRLAGRQTSTELVQPAADHVVRPAADLTAQPAAGLVVQPAVDVVGQPPAAIKPAVKSVGPLDPRRRIAPIASLDELIERVAYVFENSLDVDELERVLGGLAQAAPLSDEARIRFTPVAKRLPKLRTPLAHEVGRMLHFLLTGERIAAAPAQNVWGTNLADQHLIQRVDAIMDLAAQGKSLVPLTTPTHLRGFIDPGAFVERVRAHLAANAVTSVHEQASALLRLAPDADSRVLEAARELPDTEFTRALRYALGDQVKRLADSTLFAAAERIRLARGEGTARRYEWFPRPVEKDAGVFRLDFRMVDPSAEPSPDPVTAIELAIAARNKRGWFDQPTVGGRDEGFIVYHSMLVPSDLEVFLSDGAAELACNIHWQQTAWQNAAYLRALLDPTVAMSPMATLLLAVGLAGKEPGQTAIAVDALVQSHVQGRLDTSLLAGTVRDLLRVDLVTNARYAKSLRAALRIDATISGVIFQVLCTALEANPGSPPKDTTAIIELLLEIAATDARKLSAHERGTLEQLALSGKANSLRTNLLKRA